MIPIVDFELTIFEHTHNIDCAIGATQFIHDCIHNRLITEHDLPQLTIAYAPDER